jgi:organic radical activating enzyme
LYIEPQGPDKAVIGYCCADNNGTLVDKKDISIHHEVLEAGRQQWLQTGKFPKSCDFCEMCDKHGMLPKFQDTYHTTFQNFLTENGYDPFKTELLKLDYNTYSHCNLACIGCMPSLSSTWHDEIENLVGKSMPRKKTKNFSNELPFDTSDINYLYFNGGEPMLNKDMEKFIKRCVDNGVYPAVGFHTNGTQPITPELEKLWSKLPVVVLHVSTTDAHEQFEYNRWPAKWDQMVKFYDQLEKIKQKGHINLKYVCATDLGISNLYTVQRLNNFCVERNIEHNIYPTRGEFDLKHYPTEAISPDFLADIKNDPDENFKKQFFAILEYCETIKEVNWSWINRFHRLDDMRNLNWKEVYPALWDSVKHYSEAVPDIAEITKKFPLGIKSKLIAKG